MRPELASLMRQVHLTVSVVRYTTRLEAPRFGVCSTYLAGLTPAADAFPVAQPQAADTVRVWLRKGCLRLPASPRAAIIMVGPGTGEASPPFFSFHCSFLPLSAPFYPFPPSSYGNVWAPWHRRRALPRLCADARGAAQ